MRAGNNIGVMANLKNPPMVAGSWLWGSAVEFRNDTLSFLTRSSAMGDMVLCRVLHKYIYILYHPDHIQHILHDNHRNYLKSKEYIQIVHLLGKGLLTSEGEFWKKQRRTAQPAFHKERISAFTQTMTGCIQVLAEQWEYARNEHRVLDIHQEMMNLTMNIAGKALLGTDVSSEQSEVRSCMAYLLGVLNDRVLSPLKPPMFIPTPANLKFKKCARILDKIIFSIIEQRRGRESEYPDLLSMLMMARDEETGYSMSNEQLRNEVMTIFLAGHETSGNALTWTWYLLSQHPEVEARLHRELAEVLGGKLPTLEDLPQLTYTTWVIEEAMRLYPPAWAIGRRNVDEDVIGGYRIPKDSDLLLCSYVAHRNPAFWEKPDNFYPEHFAPEKVKARPRYTYFPFGGGPRLCIGNNFAMMEMQLAVAIIAQRFKPRLLKGHPVQAETLLTLRPKYGMKMELH